MSFFPTKVLVAADGSEEAKLAADAAVDLSNCTGSELHVATVRAEYHPVYHEVSVPTHLYEKALETLEREAQGILDEQSRRIEEAGGKVAQTHVGVGDRRDQEIVRIAEEIGAGLIVVGSRGLGGLKRALMGSVSDSVVRHAHCPVMVVREAKDAARAGERSGAVGASEQGGTVPQGA